MFAHKAPIIVITINGSFGGWKFSIYNLHSADAKCASSTTFCSVSGYINYFPHWHAGETINAINWSASWGVATGDDKQVEWRQYAEAIGREKERHINVCSSPDVTILCCCRCCSLCRFIFVGKALKRGAREHEAWGNLKAPVIALFYGLFVVASHTNVECGKLIPISIPIAHTQKSSTAVSCQTIRSVLLTRL